MVWSAIASAVAPTVVNKLFGGGKSVDPVEQYEAMQSSANAFALDHATKMPSAQVEGWKLAGIHPLAGLGLATPGQPGVGSFGGGDDKAAIRRENVNEMGQGISRAIAAYQSPEERAFIKATAGLSLERQQLENDRLRSEIALMRSPGSPPGLSAAGSDADARYPRQANNPIGFGDAGPTWRHAINEFGEKSRVLNEDVIGDNEVLQALSSVVTLGDMFGNWVKSARSPGGRASSFFRKHGKYPHTRWERR